MPSPARGEGAFIGTGSEGACVEYPARRDFPFSRHASRPSFAKTSPSNVERAQGRPGADRTHGPRATRKHAAEPQVRAEHPAFPARWFTGLYVISPGTGVLAPVVCNARHEH